MRTNKVLEWFANCTIAHQFTGLGPKCHKILTKQDEMKRNVMSTQRHQHTIELHEWNKSRRPKIILWRRQSKMKIHYGKKKKCFVVKFNGKQIVERENNTRVCVNKLRCHRCWNSVHVHCMRKNWRSLLFSHLCVHCWFYSGPIVCYQSPRRFRTL